MELLVPHRLAHVQLVRMEMVTLSAHTSGNVFESPGSLRKRSRQGAARRTTTLRSKLDGTTLQMLALVLSLEGILILMHLRGGRDANRSAAGAETDNVGLGRAGWSQAGAGAARRTTLRGARSRHPLLGILEDGLPKTGTIARPFCTFWWGWREGKDTR
jgi:hypothetical protein